MQHASNTMTAASKGVEMDQLRVVDFLPGDSVPWKKRTKLKSKGIRHPGIQTQIMKRTFGFA
jgi:hypothetical protein